MAYRMHKISFMLFRASFAVFVFRTSWRMCIAGQVGGRLVRAKATVWTELLMQEEKLVQVVIMLRALFVLLNPRTYAWMPLALKVFLIFNLSAT